MDKQTPYIVPELPTKKPAKESKDSGNTVGLMEAPAKSATAERKRRLHKPEVTQKKEQIPEKPKVPSQDTEFGAKILTLLHTERQHVQVPTQPENQHGDMRTEQPTAVPQYESAVSNAEYPIRRAREIGHDTVRLIHKVRTDILHEDIGDEVNVPTNVQPLERADSEMHEALQQLDTVVKAKAAPDKPINSEQQLINEPALLINNNEVNPLAEAMPGSASEQEPAAVNSNNAREEMLHSAGGDLEYRHTARAEKPLGFNTLGMDKTQHLKELAAMPSRLVTKRKIGIIAAGFTAAIAGFSWYRVRRLHKEQRKIKQQINRMELDAQAQESPEQTFNRVATSANETVSNSRQHRQEVVKEVSAYAHQQAQEIRHVASQVQAEKVQQPDNNSLVNRVDIKPAPAMAIEKPFVTPSELEQRKPQRTKEQQPQPAARSVEQLKPQFIRAEQHAPSIERLSQPYQDNNNKQASGRVAVDASTTQHSSALQQNYKQPDANTKQSDNRATYTPKARVVNPVLIYGALIAGAATLWLP